MSVKCPRCRSDNPDGAQFCNRCGATIPQVPGVSPVGAVAVKCLKCGAMNSSELRKCGSCGADLTESLKIEVNRPPTPPPNLCPYCGRQVDHAAGVCKFCGVDLATGKASGKEHSDPKPVYAAVLMFGTGALGIFSVVYSLVFQELPVEYVQLQPLRECCGWILIVLVAVCLTGGYFAMRRQHFTLAIVGAIAGMLTVGVYVGFMMSLIALVLLAISQKEFEN